MRSWGWPPGPPHRVTALSIHLSQHSTPPPLTIIRLILSRTDLVALRARKSQPFASRLERHLI